MILAHDLRFLKIVEKIIDKANKFPFMHDFVSGNSPFGIPLHVKSSSDYSEKYLKLCYIGGSGAFPRNKVHKNRRRIDKWKVVADHLACEHSVYPRSVIQSMFILGPGEICNDSYIVLGFETSEEKAMNIMSYIGTRFVQFLIMGACTRKILSKDSFLFVPAQDWERRWDDEKLYAKYNLSQEDIAYIETYALPKS